ncbi:NlpC/P60 family protein [Clostridium swellfunianum]|uniref:C40 family peptidase n=1 Tax=Clostridium swellfunianum TaxID=1367462 RepID=UPI002030B55B|nr:C40 family peptidase [Clostridium swellfunianum]MCM0650666.1 NlpC/P60 family protein [Clostridium swellfunianum]
MKRTSRYIAIMLTLNVIVYKPVFAAPSSNQIQSEREQLQADKNELKRAQEKRFEIEQRIENLDNQIEEVMVQVEENKKKILKGNQDIKITEKDLNESEENLRKEQELFSKRMKAMYVNGIDSYIQIILESKGFNDFLSRVEIVKNIIETDKKITANLKAKQEELNIKRKKLSDINNQLIAINNENNKKMSNLKLSKDEQNELIKEAERQERSLAAEVNESQARLNETLRQIQSIRNSTPKYTPSRGAVSVSSNAVVAYASNFLGTPYKWGGTTPAGFDCSGFTQYVYRHFGINLGRTTYNQINDGYSVSRDELQPGDLVFYGKGGSPSHMGIYVGNGMYIHAPRTGDVVKISSYSRPDYITARRVMK